MSSRLSQQFKMLSWILLALVAGLTLFASLASVGVAYFAEEDPMGNVIQRSELAGDRADVATMLRARRGTAAAYGTGYGLLFLIIALVPYRRGDVWAWWAILLGTIVPCSIILLRKPLLGTNLGLVAATIPLGVSVVALLLDVSRVKIKGA
ncbi:MAG: hypothetical protein BMS9Abin37_1330 [Acidobacteriota bacterium]|nr:MAG: hypothetical protein BMS9Abin37_1330 [Acidobacteriota bacterium]